MEPAKIYQTLVETGNAVAQARYEWELLDGQTKPMLAQFTLEAKQVDGVGSMAEATQIALAASQYREHLKSVAKARLEYGLAESTYKASDALWRAQQTVESTERAAARAQT